MRIDATVDVNLLPIATEQMIWDDWDSRRQADLLIAMANRFHNDRQIVSAQIGSMFLSLYATTTQEGQKRVENFLETMIDYFNAMKAG